METQGLQIADWIIGNRLRVKSKTVNRTCRDAIKQGVAIFLAFSKHLQLSGQDKGHHPPEESHCPRHGGMVKLGPILGWIPQHAFMNRQLKEAVPDVKLFRFGPVTGWFYGFIQLDKKHIAQPKQAILAAFANDIYLKYVVCFDTDIDIENGAQMAWALSTRVQADRDVMILPGVLGTNLDLSAPEESVVTKVGIDATAKPFRRNMPPLAKLPDEVMARINLKDFIANLEDCV